MLEVEEKRWGGRRPGAGRKKGPAKRRIDALVLADTAAQLDVDAARAGSIGKALDEWGSLRKERDALMEELRNRAALSDATKRGHLKIIAEQQRLINNQAAQLQALGARRKGRARAKAPRTAEADAAGQQLLDALGVGQGGDLLPVEVVERASRTRCQGCPGFMDGHGLLAGDVLCPSCRAARVAALQG